MRTNATVKIYIPGEQTPRLYKEKYDGVDSIDYGEYVDIKYEGGRRLIYRHCIYELEYNEVRTN